jgi:hypothetical protein
MDLRRWTLGSVTPATSWLQLQVPDLFGFLSRGHDDEARFLQMAFCNVRNRGSLLALCSQRGGDTCKQRGSRAGGQLFQDQGKGGLKAATRHTQKAINNATGLQIQVGSTEVLSHDPSPSDMSLSEKRKKKRQL